MIKKTEKWVYYVCNVCKAKKYIPIGKYQGEEELTCNKCKKLQKVEKSIDEVNNLKEINKFNSK